jgi:hypothetical protein
MLSGVSIAFSFFNALSTHIFTQCRSATLMLIKMRIGARQYVNIPMRGPAPHPAGTAPTPAGEAEALIRAVKTGAV